MEYYSDIIGIIGVGMVLVAYYLIQNNIVTSINLSFSLLNLFGATLILYSLYFHWNLASVVIEFAWITISIQGLLKIMRKDRRSTA